MIRDESVISGTLIILKGGIAMRYDLMKKNVSESFKEATLYKEKKDILCPTPMNGGACINEGICYPEGISVPVSND